MGIQFVMGVGMSLNNNDRNDRNKIGDQQFSLKQWFAVGNAAVTRQAYANGYIFEQARANFLRINLKETWETTGVTQNL